MGKVGTFAERHAKLILAASVAASSFSAIFTRFAGSMPALAIGFYRLSFSLPFFLAVLFANKEERRALGKLTARQLLMPLAAGILLAMHFISWFLAVAKTTIVSATVLCAMHPVFIVAMCGVFLKERITVKMLLAILITMLGAVVLAGGDFSSFAGSNMSGDLFALGAAAFLSVYWVIGRQARKQISAGVYITLTFVACWLTMLAGMLIFRVPFTGYSGTSFASVLAMAVFCQIAGHAVMNWGLAYVSPMFISVVDNTSAVYTAVMGIILFREIPTVWQIVGAATAIGGLILYNYFEMQRNELRGKAENGQL